jgi:murein L,D-transpeptidase YcbB/YkuD
VVVGRTDRPTPAIEAQIQRVNFAPYWHVPESIARRDLVPTLQKDPEYLTREKIRVYRDPRWQSEMSPSAIDWRYVDGQPLHFRQDPGPWNALGLVRLDMPNAHTVYLHDTPMKDLFGRPDRSFSAGCIRVEDMPGLTTWILQGTPGWGPQQVEAAIAERRQVDVTLARPVPVVFLYATAWPGADGRMEFRRDLYQRSPNDAPPDLPPTAVARLAP